MWKLKEISAVNFKSFEKCSYAFDIGKTTLVYGVNEDEEGAESNGAGKSSLLEIIRICLLDHPSKGLTKNDYIRDGEKSCEMVLDLENKVIGNKIKINRKYHRTKSSEIYIWENNTLNDQIVSTAEGNKRILELLDLSKDDILNYFLINQRNKSSFLSSSDTYQKEVISRFSGGDQIDKVFTEIKDNISDLEADIRKVDLDTSNEETRIEVYKENIESLKEKKDEESKKLEIKGLEAEIEYLSTDVLDLREQKEKAIKKLDSLNLELTKLTKTKKDTKTIDIKIRTNKKEKRSYDSELEKLKIKLNKLVVLKESSIECPKCNYEFSLQEPDLDLDKVETDIVELKSQIENNKELIKVTKAIIDQLDEELEKVRRHKRSISKKEDEIGDQNMLINRLIRNIKSKNETIESKFKSIELIKESTFSSNEEIILKNKRDIKTSKDKIKKLKNSKENYAKKLENYYFWNVNFGNKGFKTFLINETLHIIEGNINYFLNKFNTNFKVKINGYKLLQDGDVREKIDILISKDGDNWTKYIRASGGEMQRINVCSILTLQTLINSSSKYGGLDFLALDEFFEGLDSPGQDNVINILEMSKKTVMVISHMNNDIDYNNRLIVRYKNGKSKIV